MLNCRSDVLILWSTFWSSCLVAGAYTSTNFIHVFLLIFIIICPTLFDMVLYSIALCLMFCLIRKVSEASHTHVSVHLFVYTFSFRGMDLMF